MSFLAQDSTNATPRGITSNLVDVAKVRVLRTGTDATLSLISLNIDVALEVHLNDPSFSQSVMGVIIELKFLMNLLSKDGRSWTLLASVIVLDTGHSLMAFTLSGLAHIL